MEIFRSKRELSAYLNNLKEQKKSIGFVPTMGALHQGHLSLVDIAKAATDIVVCSIFVNPTQFNDPEDLKKYPRPIDADISKLEGAACDVLFLPSVDEMYSPNESWNIDLGYLETILEGKHRPGHYQGVTQIVKKLFDIVNPDKAFFGQKDFQQVKIINKLVEIFKMPVEIMMCPILRENDGLAMSSRNIHLNELERKQALALSRSLIMTKRNFNDRSLPQLQKEGERYLQQSEGLSFEYFEICNGKTLWPLLSKEDESIVVLVAAKVGQTRLIDNIIIK